VALTNWAVRDYFVGIARCQMNDTNNKTPTLPQRIRRATAFLLRLDAAVEQQAKADANARQRERVRLAIAQRRLEIKLKTGRMVQQ